MGESKKQSASQSKVESRKRSSPIGGATQTNSFIIGINPRFIPFITTQQKSLSLLLRCQVSPGAFLPVITVAYRLILWRKRWNTNRRVLLDAQLYRAILSKVRHPITFYSNSNVSEWDLWHQRKLQRGMQIHMHGFPPMRDMGEECQQG